MKCAQLNGSTLGRTALLGFRLLVLNLIKKGFSNFNGDFEPN